mmetsp:Transcript_83040/g.165789  ORF Transcript_83040/g.165789 Transcript_83040/m.165789 type:complete len:232 (+) Transcript_83040:806-1501(+)
MHMLYCISPNLSTHGAERKWSSIGTTRYINLSDRVVPNWIVPGGSMQWRVGLAWQERLADILDEHGGPPMRIHEVQAAQAMVHARRIRARPLEVWSRLRDHAAAIQFRSDADLALEGSFHHILGEPWSRSFVTKHLDTLLAGTSNELELRCRRSPTPSRGGGTEEAAAEAAVAACVGCAGTCACTTCTCIDTGPGSGPGPGPGAAVETAEAEAETAAWAAAAAERLRGFFS